MGIFTVVGTVMTVVKNMIVIRAYLTPKRSKIRLHVCLFCHNTGATSGRQADFPS